MGFHNNAVATVWKLKDMPQEASYQDVQISTSVKNKQTGSYESDFSGYVRFVGSAVKEVKTLKEKDRIVLKETDVTRRYDKETQKEFFNCTVYAWERFRPNAEKDAADDSFCAGTAKTEEYINNDEYFIEE